jgi:hypothetical protein
VVALLKRESEGWESRRGSRLSKTIAWNIVGQGLSAVLGFVSVLKARWLRNGLRWTILWVHELFCCWVT